MKKLLCIFLILCCICTLVACAPEKQPQDSYTVYYRRGTPAYGSADGVIGQTYLLTSGREDDIPYLLRKYLASTPEDGFVSPFTQDMTLVSFELDGPTAKVVLSNQIAELSGIQLTIALVCLSRTVISLTNCQEVIISANSVQLNGQNYITLTPDSYLLLDESGKNQE